MDDQTSFEMITSDLKHTIDGGVSVSAKHATAGWHRCLCAVAGEHRNSSPEQSQVGPDPSDYRLGLDKTTPQIGGAEFRSRFAMEFNPGSLIRYACC